MWYNLTAMKNLTTERYNSPKQTRIPVLIVEKLDICDPVLVFDGIMEEIAIWQYLKPEEYKPIGRSGYNRVNILKAVLFGFMDKGYISLRELEDNCRVNLRYMYLMDGETPCYTGKCQQPSERRFMNSTIGNGLAPIIAQAIEEIKHEQGESFSLDKINLAELERRTGVSRAKLRRLKENGFVVKPHGSSGRSVPATVLTGYVGTLDALLKQGVRNSVVCFQRLQEVGYTGSQTTVKRYIRSHKHLLPAKRQLAAPQGNRGRRITTGPGESFQMDWGFTNVQDYAGKEYRAA